ncbi:hypothetical protein Ahy_A04g019649 [Arachis hypogaea]|uniref:Uncharacterized protein n=1 Tax=Arachis hypogaea TaxID=3818 RepID=A0A445DGA8_ARAHY|nr:hypothetical protein Ahy_A04g019649 [Arachis hypogaea]
MKVIKPIFIVCTKQDSKPVRSWGSLHILSGGYQNMHLIKKDVYIDNVCRSRIIQGNVTASISYLKGKTEVDPLAVVITTSRCEGINASLKSFIKSSNCLLELLENLECVVKDYRNNEFIADYKSLYSEPVMTTGVDSIERAMSQIYTREILFEVKK